MKIKPVSTKKLSQDFTLVNFDIDERLTDTDVLNILSIPLDDTIHHLPLYTPVVNNNIQTLIFQASPDLIDTLLSVQIGQLHSTFDTRFVPDLILTEPQALASGIFIAQYFRQYQPLVILSTDRDFPFHPVPSRFIVPSVSKDYFAAAPLLEDLKIPSRLASLHEMTACFHGSLVDFTQKILNNNHFERIYVCGNTLPEALLLSTDSTCTMRQLRHGNI